MGLISSIMQNQMKVDWFRNLTDEQKKELLKKYNINKSIKEETLLNEDVFFIYDKEHLGGFAEYKEIKSK